MLVELIDLFKNISSEIESALEIDDFAAIGKLDKSLDQTWNQLMSYNPANTNEVRLLAGFLIDRLVVDGNAGGINTLIKEKLIDLCSLGNSLH